MPHEEDLPRGPVRDFVEILVWLYQKGHCPALREISNEILRKDDLRGTASTETIRRMLNGTTVPRRWQIVEAVYLVLCDFARRDPGSPLNMHGRTKSIERHVEDAWQNALINPNLRYAEPEPDPWASQGAGGYSDEPPF
jgi:hypothetical protein